MKNVVTVRKIKKRNKRRADIITAVIILAIIISGIVTAGSIKGWFDGRNTTDAVVAVKHSGIYNVERNGISLFKDEDFILRKNDSVYTQKDSSIDIKYKDNIITQKDSTQVNILENNAAGIKAELTGGEVFINAGRESSVTLEVCGCGYNAADSMFSVDKSSDLVRIIVYSGSVSVDSGDKTYEITAGNYKYIAASGEIERQSETCGQLNDFERGQLGRYLYTDNDIKPQEELYTPGSTADSNSCTFEITCEAILDNRKYLKTGKDRYVPDDGIILKKIKVYFNDGDTVFDVLKFVCQNKNIQLEYSWTPIYNSYYVEGMNNLYEFDCKSQSGWMYKVNGEYANYGCSQYYLKNNDVVEWRFTCDGTGTD